MRRYTTPASTAPGMQPMNLRKLIGYLRSSGNLELTPLQSILAQAATVRDPAMPTAEQMAILEWLGAAFEQWERDFPLEEPLRSEMRRLKPLAAKLAVTDPDFLTPGGHPLHLLLDSLQLTAVGWQARLGRVGEALHKQLVNTVDAALASFEDPDVDLPALCNRVVATAGRDLARASRMMQRMIETEQGRIKTAEAKRVAADMINSSLEEFPMPSAIGSFLKGAWYESAQLVLLKFGAESQQWAQMVATTATLLDSVQAPREDEEDPGRRQHLFEIITRLPRELRRWLLSLQHDSGAIGSAMAVVEHAHMQILRKRPLQLEHTEKIPVARADAAPEPPAAAVEGQWFCMDRDKGNTLRVCLVMRIEDTGELLFANQVGLKVLRQHYQDFADLLQARKVSKLDSGASFSRCLAAAAGIETVDDLEKLLGPRGP